MSRLLNIGTLPFWRHCLLPVCVVENRGLVCVCGRRDKLDALRRARLRVSVKLVFSARGVQYSDSSLWNEHEHANERECYDSQRIAPLLRATFTEASSRFQWREGLICWQSWMCRSAMVAKVRMQRRPT